MAHFTHLNEKGEAQMVDVGDKSTTSRIASASAEVRMNSSTLQKIIEGKHKKGDVLAVARIAAIQAAKKTSDLIPLCHPLQIDHTSTKIVLDEKNYALEVYCLVSANAKTGVEMEAIMGVNAALITIYDLSKIVNPHLKIDNVKLLIKEGGKSGLWTNPDGLPKFLENIF